MFISDPLKALFQKSDPQSCRVLKLFRILFCVGLSKVLKDEEGKGTGAEVVRKAELMTDSPCEN